ncbi:hypothetical protein SD37_10690 [Amycolatopsis orientalis]|uniref:Uncharacterized protein n=1 Tax=Amycolatopsis orientalis TaxID=31958 RepID=A0A193BV60_AMYOR|nr:type I polyketide synthase [Amycolatopsis orientalis]ANN16063.1 hypothetical protein SD37_10690 [Amycolatopsis orientalis]
MNQTQDRDLIAIIGIGCRYPGGVRSAEDLWNVVRSGADVLTGFPADRGWRLDRPGRGGFVDDADRFDAAFFGISPREARAMDPQQRLLLETSWEALEHAGVAASSLRGADCGMFIGATAQDYGPRMHEAAGEGDGHLLTGSSVAVASGRLAYFYGTSGPAITVDTAQSSSLVALHLACQALRAGECSTALAGGVAVLSTPGMFVEFAKKRALAADGRCKAFSSAADGTAWAEGAGVLVLRRWPDAVRDGQRILAVVRASAVNQDGASNGLLSPSTEAQTRLIDRVLSAARLDAADVDLVEAHGTGTRVGDLAEARALAATYGRNRRVGRPVRVGSVKSNIGHAQAASGVAGVIKVIMAMRHATMPATLHVDEPCDGVDWSDRTMRLLTEGQRWPSPDRPRLAAVSSFGMSGTNAHVILEQGTVEEHPVADPASARTLPWLLSANDDKGLRALAGRMATFADNRPEAAPDAVACSLAHDRAVLRERAVIVANDHAGFRDGLGALAQGRPAKNVIRGTALDGRDDPVFLFPGQGTSWEGMAAELLRTSPVFRDKIEACERVLASHVDWSLTAVLRDGPLPEQADVVQPVLFAVMVSLAELWRSFGVTPKAVIGQAEGEIAAAHVSGALTLEDAIAVVALRGKALAGLAHVRPFRTGTVFYSALDGRAVDTDRLGATYWHRNLGEPVRFDEAVRAAHAAGHRGFIEVSAHPVLTEIIEGILESVEDDAVWVRGTLRRGDGGMPDVLAGVAEAYVRGCPVTWGPVLGDAPRRYYDLPTYPFQGERYWLPASTDKARARQTRRARKRRDHNALDLVREHVRAVLGYEDSRTVHPSRNFRDLGVDSLLGIELCERLRAATGLPLPLSLVFDHATPGALARWLQAEMAGASAEAEQTTRASTAATDTR